MKYTECDKLQEVAKKSAVLSEFVEWMGTQNMSFIKNFPDSEGGGSAYFNGSYEQLFADFFGIDLKQVEKERQHMLANLRDILKTVKDEVEDDIDNDKLDELDKETDEVLDHV